MWTYLFSFLLFRRLRLSKPFQYLLALLPCGTRNCIVTKPISGTQQFFPLRSRRPD